MWEDQKSPERRLLDAIADGELDDHLVAIADAVHARRELLHTVRSATALSKFCLRDTVQFNRNVRPRYLQFEIGEVIDVGDHTIAVKLLRPVGRFHSGEVHCPPLALDRIRPGQDRG